MHWLFPFVRTTLLQCVQVSRRGSIEDRRRIRGEILGVRVLGEGVWRSFCSLLFLCFLLDMGDES